MDTFVFWPVRGDPLAQIESFAGDVVPRVRRELGQSLVLPERFEPLRPHLEQRLTPIENPRGQPAPR